MPPGYFKQPFLRQKGTLSLVASNVVTVLIQMFKEEALIKLFNTCMVSHPIAFKSV